MFSSVFSDPASDEPESSPPSPERLILSLAALMLSGVGFLMLSLIVAQTGAVQSPNAPALRSSTAAEANENASPESRAPALETLPSHPSNALDPYLNPSAPASAARHPLLLQEFHVLVNQHVHQQTQDDNFTIRVIDRRTDTVLELFELADLRAKYRRNGSIDWWEVDEHRRDATDRLVETYTQRGVPLDDIIVRWGRANQVEAAHRRDRAYQAYERRLARSFGLGLLATEIGTVETFNQDHLVSPVGARSRYQMMPWILRRSGVNEYALPAEGGTRVHVQESLHPLLVLKPAFLLLRGYVNAVGHEIPGLSAYHTGPGNIFKLYRQYITESNHLTASSTVADAYAWGVTEGFDVVSEGSTFGGDSRGYVPALYGSLVARDDQSPAPSALQAVRLQIEADTSVTLRTILGALEAAGRSLGWGPRANGSLYDRFRTLNSHFDLPPASGDQVPADGNVRLVSSIDGKAVRFFLPLEAPAALRSAGLHVLDSTKTLRYDTSTYAPPSPSQMTHWDRQYRALVNDTENFGFTRQNRNRLLRLHDRFEALAGQSPTRFRRRQLRIISTHRRLWLSSPWEELADATEAAAEQMPVRAQPPDSLPVDPPDLQDLRMPVPPR
jgi:hypothetical protein